MTKTLILTAAAAIGLMTTAAPAGSDAPMVLRVVTMDGRTGPALYSAIEGRYRFVEAPPAESRFVGLSETTR